MSKELRVWKGTGYNANALLKECEYSDGSIHYTFYPRTGLPANPSKEEAEMIIKRWNLKEI